MSHGCWVLIPCAHHVLYWRPPCDPLIHSLPFSILLTALQGCLLVTPLMPSGFLSTPEIGKRGRRECGLGIYAPGPLSVQLPEARYSPWGRSLLHSDALLFKWPLSFVPVPSCRTPALTPPVPGWWQLCRTCPCPACAFVNTSSINPCVFSPCEPAERAPAW